MLANDLIRTLPERLKKHPIEPNGSEHGTIQITKYSTKISLKTFTDDVIKAKREGTTCVLTQKNDQALLAFGMLRKQGIPARLMQTNDSFRLTDLVEIDFFMQQISKDKDLVKISKESWETAREALDRTYSRSIILENCHSLLETFSRVTQKGVYINDFRTFLFESRLEDFMVCSEDCVQIGTMHKAKGKEFDSVFIYAPYSRPALSPEELRVLYVAVTRAKKNLSIHTNTSLFDTIRAPGLTRQTNRSIYSQPSELIMQAWHTDVHLDFFLDLNRQKIYRELQSGDVLEYRDYYCYYKGHKIIRFSASFKERIQKITDLGYHPSEAIVHYIVYWKKQETTDRSLILLPELRFERSSDYTANANNIADVFPEE